MRSTSYIYRIHPNKLLLASDNLTCVELATNRFLCPGYANRHPIESLAWGGSATLLTFTKKTKFKLPPLRKPTFDYFRLTCVELSSGGSLTYECQIAMILCSIESLMQARKFPTLTQRLAFKKKSNLNLSDPYFRWYVRQSKVDAQRQLAVSNLNFSNFYSLNQFVSSSAFDCMWLHGSPITGSTLGWNHVIRLNIRVQGVDAIIFAISCGSLSSHSGSVTTHGV